MSGLGGVLCEGLVGGDLAESQEGQDLVRQRDAAERARFGVHGLEGLGIGMEFCPPGSPPKIDGEQQEKCHSFLEAKMSYFCSALTNQR